MGKDAELYQIAAINQAGDQFFAESIFSNRNIERHASKVIMQSCHTNINAQLALHKEMNPVQIFTHDEAFTLFLSFFEKSVQQIKKSTSKNVCSVLIGHNTKRFDVSQQQ